MRDALTAKGYPVGYSEYDGGHSFLNWNCGAGGGRPAAGALYTGRQNN